MKTNNYQQGTATKSRSYTNFGSENITQMSKLRAKFKVGDIVYEVSHNNTIRGIFAYKVTKVLDDGNSEIQYVLSATITPWSHEPNVTFCRMKEIYLTDRKEIEIPGREIEDKESYKKAMIKWINSVNPTILKELSEL